MGIACSMILDYIQWVRQTDLVCFSIQAGYFEQGPNECPDKKGIETCRCHTLPLLIRRIVRMSAPIRRGLRLGSARYHSKIPGLQCPNECPDKKGIETLKPRP